MAVSYHRSTIHVPIWIPPLPGPLKRNFLDATNGNTVWKAEKNGMGVFPCNGLLNVHRRRKGEGEGKTSGHLRAIFWASCQRSREPPGVPPSPETAPTGGWIADIPITGNALTKAGDTLFVAGSTVQYPAEDFKKIEAGYEGRSGGTL